MVLLSTFVGSVGCRKESDEWAVVKATIREKFPTVRHLTTEELRGWLSAQGREQPLLLDVRAPDEYTVSHLKGARSAPTLKEALELLRTVPKERSIVVYCSVGYRSSVMVERLQQAGFSEVRNLEGSIFQWANEGGPVYRGEIQAEEVHPYDEKWGRLLDRRLWSFDAAR